MSDEIKKEELPVEEELNAEEIEQVSGGIDSIKGHFHSRVYCTQCKRMVKTVDHMCEYCGKLISL